MTLAERGVDVTGFSVRPAALTTFANTLCSTNSGGSDAGPEGLDYEFVMTAQNYANKWVKLEAGTGGVVFGNIVGTMDSLCAQLSGNYSRISELLVASANGLTTAADRYRTQDRATAAQFDSLLRPSGVRPVPDTVDVSRPHVDPATTLTEPGEDGAVPDVMQQILDGIGYFSESDIVLKILSLCGLDVEDWVKERLLGDYRALARCRNAIINLSRFDDAAATTIAEDTGTMLRSWKGAAAAAAANYFDELAGDIGGHANTLSSLAQKLDALITGIQQGGFAVIGVLASLLDEAAEAAASAAAASCLEEVPVADVIMDGASGWRIVRLVKRMHELADVWAKVWASLQFLLGAITSTVGALQSYDTAGRLPAAGYRAAAR